MVNAVPPNFRENVLNEGLLSKAWSRFISELTERVGSGQSYTLGGQLTNDTTSVGNVGAGVDDLITYLLEKNTFQNTGDVIEITAYGTTAANANNKTIKLLLGSTELLTTGALAFNNKDWQIKTTLTRTGSATQKSIAVFSGDTALLTQVSSFVSGTEDFTTALTIKCTGEATSNNDIIQQGLTINFYPVR